jgi:hypothetical protein
LVGDDKSATAAAAKYKDSLQIARTVKLGKAKETGDAEFFVMLSNTGATTTIEGVHFISGDEKMKSYADALRTAKYGVSFPDGTPVRFLRRGGLSCSKVTGECIFVLFLPEDVRSVN